MLQISDPCRSLGGVGRWTWERGGGRASYWREQESKSSCVPYNCNVWKRLPSVVRTQKQEETADVFVCTQTVCCVLACHTNVRILMASPLPGSSGPAGFSLDLSPSIRSPCASREPGNTFQSACRGCSSCFAGPGLALLVRLPYGDYVWDCEGCPTADGENRVF